MKIEKVGLLTKIWGDKQWQFPTVAAQQSAFDNLCALLSMLNEEEQYLFINLTKLYSVYSLTQYYSLQIKALNNIDVAVWHDVDEVIFLPIVKQQDLDKHKAKSAHSLIYSYPLLIQHSTAPSGLTASARAIPIIDRDKINSHKILVVLVDDFVGSGRTVEDAALPVKGMLLEQDKIIILSLVTMQQGVDYLQQLSLPIFYAELVEAGIKNNPYITDKNHAYQLIDQIWQKYLKVHKDYMRGYQGCEALVTLARTPNNTLPMYWVKNHRNDSNWPAPFPR